ncbi:hypothetical protein [Clostridium sp.]|uniref:hypothetical protein n=1 Tax=Clostridium sp. TaxID=1506 RepID=UPI003463C000
MLKRNDNNQVNKRIEIGTVIDVYPRSKEDLKSIREELMKIVEGSMGKIILNYEFIGKEGKARFILWGNNNLIEKIVNIMHNRV